MNRVRPVFVDPTLELLDLLLSDPEGMAYPVEAFPEDREDRPAATDSEQFLALDDSFPNRTEDPHSVTTRKRRKTDAA